jgi:AcrR family transcriptional regulator
VRGGKATASKRRGKDRRIGRTQALLREALASLIHEKSYDSISVQEILDRANVGRSTFYTHFADKDELLASGLQGMLLSIRSTAPPAAKRHEKIVWFSRAVFEHIHRTQGAGKGPIGPRGRAILHEHLQKALAELIAEDVRREFQGRGKGALSHDLLAQYVASTFILVLNWWVERRSPISPQEADALFRGLVLPTLAAA